MLINISSNFFLRIFVLAAVYSAFGMCSSENYNNAVFLFPDYDYKETAKNELTYKEYESACDQSKRCENLTSVYRTRCVRECISPSCYSEIYEFDELEEGEIDVRLNSFKGCFIQRTGRNRNR